MSDRFRNC